MTILIKTRRLEILSDLPLSHNLKLRIYRWKKNMGNTRVTCPNCVTVTWIMQSSTPVQKGLGASVSPFLFQYFSWAKWLLIFYPATHSIWALNGVSGNACHRHYFVKCPTTNSHCYCLLDLHVTSIFKN